jgi:hypothetical protein
MTQTMTQKATPNSEIKLPVRLGVGKMRNVIAVSACLILAVGAFFVRSLFPVGGYVVMVIFGLAALVLAVNFHPRAAYLLLTTEGFTIVSLFRPTFVPWSAVTKFYPFQVTSKLSAWWEYTGEYTDAHLSKFVKAVSTEGRGKNVLPDNYGMEATELVDILNALLARYRNSAA